MNLIEALIYSELLTHVEKALQDKIEETTGKISPSRVFIYLRPTLEPRDIRSLLRKLTHKITNIRVTQKGQSTATSRDADRYIIISFDASNHRYKCVWDNIDKELKSRSVNRIVTS